MLYGNVASESPKTKLAIGMTPVVAHRTEAAKFASVLTLGIGSDRFEGSLTIVVKFTTGFLQT